MGDKIGYCIFWVGCMGCVLGICRVLFVIMMVCVWFVIVVDVVWWVCLLWGKVGVVIWGMGWICVCIGLFFFE